MKVRSKLDLMAVLPALMTVIICAILFKVYSTVDAISRSMSGLDRAVEESFDLSKASHQYLQSPTPAMAEAWQARYEALGKSLASFETEGHVDSSFSLLGAFNPDRIFSDRGLRKRINDENRELARLFTVLKTASSAHVDIHTIPEAENMLGSLDILTQDILSLSSIGQRGTSAIQTTGYMVIVIICVALSFIMLMISIPFGVSLSTEARRLMNAITAMSQGDSDAVLSVERDDELGDVARAFMAMRKQVFDSRQAVKNELEEHRKLSASLQTSNQQLSDVLSRLERAKHQAIQQERHQAIQQLAQGVVHDLNSSLTPIIGMTEFLKMDPDLMRDKPDIIEAMEMIDQSAQNCRKVVMSLVELVRPIRSETTEVVDLNNVLEETAEITRHAWQDRARLANIQIDMHLDPAPAPVLVNSKISDIEECLTNLILNAVDAMPRGGVLTLSCRDVDGQAVLSVTDTGVGMSADVRARCFEPFYSSKTKEASGMGLTATRIIIGRYRGTIEIASMEDKGTTVTIRLPKSVPSTTLDATTPVPSGTIRLLAVDDEEWATRVLRKHLAHLGYEVTTAHSAYEVLELFKPNTFGAVLMDRAMPGINGDELAARLKRIQPDLLVIMVTGFADLMQEQGSTSNNVDIVLAKPFTQAELTSVMSRCQEMRWKGLRK